MHVRMELHEPPHTNSREALRTNPRMAPRTKPGCDIVSQPRALLPFLRIYGIFISYFVCICLVSENSAGDGAHSSNRVIVATEKEANSEV